MRRCDLSLPSSDVRYKARICIGWFCICCDRFPSAPSPASTQLQIWACASLRKESALG